MKIRNFIGATVIALAVMLSPATTESTVVESEVAVFAVVGSWACTFRPVSFRKETPPITVVVSTPGKVVLERLFSAVCVALAA